MPKLISPYLQTLHSSREEEKEGRIVEFGMALSNQLFRHRDTRFHIGSVEREKRTYDCVVPE